MRKIYLFLFCSIFLVVTQNARAQKKYASTFLWKITGNGLVKPSYMYGTMHLQDKELFNLGDSIYYALENVDGFSMEVDPVALMDALIKTLNDKDESPLLKDVIEEKKLKKIEKNIEKKFGVTPDKLTIKKVKKYIQNKVYQKRQGQMKTFMDMYLYNIAKTQNKKFAPVEDVEDQMSIMDNYNAKSLEKYLETDSVGEENYLQDFKNIYIKKDLTALAKTIENDNEGTYNNLALVKRNIKMARRIDSLTKIRTSFIAIGAAHLPGDSGLIKLLQNKGFIVEPVITKKNIKPEEYKYKAPEKDWVNSGDDDGLITLQMPMEPTIKPKSESIDMKMSMDLTDYSLYGFGAVNSGEAIMDITKMSDKMMDYYKKIGFEILSNKQITQNGVKGIEFIGRENNEYFFRTKVLLKDKTMAILICGAQNKKYLYDENFERFFNSLKFNENVKTKEWVEFVNEEIRYSVQLPKKPNKSNDDGEEDASTIHTYSSTDASDGATYMCQTVMPKAGYYFQSDSDYYNNYKKALNENTKNGIQYFSPAVLNNIPAMHFSVAMKQDDFDIIMQGYIFRRANVFQILMAVTSKETADYPNVSGFFNSYKNLPLKKTNWIKQEINEVDFIVNAPSDFIKRKQDTLSTSTGLSFLAEDKNTATTFYVDVDSVTKYYWYKNDSASYRAICNNYKEYTDSAVSYKYDTTNYTAEILLKMQNSNLYKKVKMAVNGNKIYTLFSYFPQEIMTGEDEQKYFKEYKFTTILKPTIFENNIKLLTDSLASTDSITSLKSFQALNTNAFTKSDLPFLHNALLKNYSANDSAEGEYRTSAVAAKIRFLADTSSISFIASNYYNKTTSTIKVSMLEILSNIKIEKSYALLKSLLLKSDLKSCTAYGFAYDVRDTLELAKTLFPEVTILYKDTLLGGAMMQIANKLLDSNMISKSMALQNQDGILQHATHQILVYKRDKINYGMFSSDIINMLGRINNKQANELLQKYFTYGEVWDKELAIVQLLKNDAVVLPANILKTAADLNNRTAFYDDLKKVGKEKYFPKAYLTQQKFAEGYFYELLTQEYEQEEPKLIFISEKISKVGGIEKRYFLYKIKNVYDGEVTYNLGIIGGFEKNIQKVALSYDDQQYYYDYDEKFNAATINKVYDNFIKQQNENLKINK